MNPGSLDSARAAREPPLRKNALSCSRSNGHNLPFSAMHNAGGHIGPPLQRQNLSLSRSLANNIPPLRGSRRGKGASPQASRWGAISVEEEGIVPTKMKEELLDSSPHRISLRSKRSASATFPPSSVRNDPQGGSNSPSRSRAPQRVVAIRP